MIKTHDFHHCHNIAYRIATEFQTFKGFYHVLYHGNSYRNLFDVAMVIGLNPDHSISISIAFAIRRRKCRIL